MTRTILFLCLFSTFLLCSGCQKQDAAAKDPAGSTTTTTTDTGVSATNNGAKELSLNPNGRIEGPGSALKK